jgi:hypothetical protein
MADQSNEDEMGEPIGTHYHEAHYDENGQLTRACEACGKDLLHPSHVRGTTMVHPTALKETP